MRSMIFTSCMPQLSTVTSEIMPMLSPKQEPPATAHSVSSTSPPTRWFSHRKMGAQAAKVPQLEPVAMESTQVTSMETMATVRAVIPRRRAIRIREAPTPVAIKHSATP